MRRILRGVPVLLVSLWLGGCYSFYLGSATYEAGSDLNTPRLSSSLGYVSGEADEQTYTLTFIKGLQFSLAIPSSDAGTGVAGGIGFAAMARGSAVEFSTGSLGSGSGSFWNTGLTPRVAEHFGTGQPRWETVFLPGGAFTDDSSTSAFKNDLARLPSSAVEVPFKGQYNEDSAVISWGRWTGVYRSNADSSPGCCTSNISAHYVLGVLTPDSALPLSGTATFNLIGGTSPTISNGSLSPGTLDATSKVSVLWGGATNTFVGLDLRGSLGGSPFTVISPGGLAEPGVQYDPATRAFSMTNSPVDGSSARGFFAGPTASHIGVTYSAPRDSATIQGAAAFKR